MWMRVVHPLLLRITTGAVVSVIHLRNDKRAGKRPANGIWAVVVMHNSHHHHTTTHTLEAMRIYPSRQISTVHRVWAITTEVHARVWWWAKVVRRQRTKVRRPCLKIPRASRSSLRPSRGFGWPTIPMILLLLPVAVVWESMGQNLRLLRSSSRLLLRLVAGMDSHSHNHSHKQGIISVSSAVSMGTNTCRRRRIPCTVVVVPAAVVLEVSMVERAVS
mmetsp:Transcript_2116/g.3367  ORF Transcript_2116/g.3367 Transcript_2116/m.3367 type:complete len:218 (-) Transcript_2116:2544-3197(-)